MRRKLIISVGLLLYEWSSCPSVTAQENDEDVARQETVIITGTRRSERSAIDSPAPIDVISGLEFGRIANNDVQDLLRTSVPSYNVNTQPISDAATLIRPANLRGLSPDNALVLVNGKRAHRGAVIAFLGGGLADGSQPVDVSTIPSIALKQVEVLRDGASSQYGSDAIAGVINFILDDSPEGGRIEAKYGSTYEDDGENLQFAAKAGFRINNNGFLNVSAEWQETDATDRSVQRDDVAALLAAGNTAVTDISVNTVDTDSAQIWGQPNVNGDTKLYANFGLPVTDSAEVYAFANYAERETEGGFFYRNPTNRGGVYAGPLVDPVTGAADPNGVPSVLVGNLSGASATACPAGIPLAQGGLIPDPTVLAAVIADGNCFSFIETLPGGFVPRFGGELEDRSYAIGLRGDLEIGAQVLSYDASYRYGQNDIDFFINNTLNASLGPDSPRKFRPGGYSQVENLFNLDFAYGLDVGLASDLNIAFGYEYRDEEFEIRQGDAASFQIGPLAQPTADFPTGQGFASSSNGFGGFTPNSAGKSSQSNNAVYVDVEGDFTDALTLQAAVRLEDTEAFGNSTNYKISGLYRVNDNVRLRSTYSTGFHVPTVGQANVVNVTTAFVGGVLNDEGTFPLNSAAGNVVSDYLVSLGQPRPTLEPEESENVTLGAGFNVGGFDVTVDYFNITLDDRISRSSTQPFLPALQSLAGNNGVDITDLGTAQAINALDTAGVLNASDFAGSEDLAAFAFFNNAFDTETQGIDLVVAGDVKFVPWGDSQLAIAANWTETEVTRVDATITPGRVKVLEEGLPQYRFNATITNQTGPWSFLGRLSYYGEGFEDHLDSNLALPIDIDAAAIFDAEVGYGFDNGFEIVFGVNNLFDTFPNDNPFSGVVGAQYPVTTAYGFNGGSYYLKGRYSW